MFFVLALLLVAHADIDVSRLSETPKKVCPSDNCKGTWSNPLPRGKQWISIGTIDGLCCWGRPCEGCVDPQGEMIQNYLRDNPHCSVSGAQFSGGCTAEGLMGDSPKEFYTSLPGLREDYTMRPCRSEGIAGDEQCEERIASYKCRPSLMKGDWPILQVAKWPSLEAVSHHYDIATAGCLEQKYLVNWYDKTADMCHSIIASPGESWGLLPVPGWNKGDKNFNCIGRCGNGCEGNHCSNWNMACFIHDICSMFHGSTKAGEDPVCGPHWKQGILPFIDICANKPQCENLKDGTGSGWTLLRSDVECGNNANEVYLGTFESVDACAQACKDRDGCTYFIFGKKSRLGICWDEAITESECTKWTPHHYDFYRLDVSDAVSQVKAREETALGTENNRLRKANKALMDVLEELSN